MEKGRNFLKEIEEENLAKARPKPVKQSSFKHSAISRIQQQDGKMSKQQSDSSDGQDDDEEEKDSIESVDKISDLPLPHSMFAKPAPKFKGHGIKYTKGDDYVPQNRLSTKYEPLKWSDAFDERDLISSTVPIYFSGTKGPVLFCIHGAGHSALSFGPLAKAVKDFARVAAFDLRGHGGHHHDDETNMPCDILLKE
jgi:hypothetical protein